MLEQVGAVVADLGARDHVDAHGWSDAANCRSSSANTVSSAVRDAVQQHDVVVGPERVEQRPQRSDADAAGDEQDAPARPALGR